MTVTSRTPTRREMAGQIGAVVLDLINSRVRDPVDGRVKFTDSDKTWGAAGGFGAYTSMQGLRAVMGGLMAVGLDDTLWAAALPHIPSLLDEWRGVLDDPERFSSCKPYKGHDRFAELLDELGGKDRIFTDATSWLLSTALVVNSVLPDLNARGVATDDIASRCHAAVIETLNLLIAAQLPDGGWHFGGHAPNASGHLFFTWGVLQGFADFSDYVLGESADEIGVQADADLIAIVGAPLVESFKASRTLASAFLKSTYLEPVLDSGIDYKALAVGGFNVPVRLSVEDPGGEIPLLYAYAYLQESLILNGVDKDGISTLGYTSASATADMKTLQEIIRGRFERGQQELAAAGDKETAVNISTFFLRARAKRQRGPTTPEFLFKDPSLWPQLVRTFVLYPYYVDRTDDPDPYVFDAYRLLMDDRRSAEETPGSGLWDRDAFNLSVSSRAVEALIDIYDYVELFEADVSGPGNEIEPVPPVSEPGDLAAVLAAALAPHIRSMLQPNKEQALPVVADIDWERLAEEVQQRVDLTVLSPFNYIPLEVERKWKSTTMTFDKIAQEVHGAADVPSFQREDPVAYTVFRSITGINFYTFAKCLPHLLEQALLYIATDEQRRALKRRLEKQKSTLQEEILHQMQAVLQQIIEGTDESLDMGDAGSPILSSGKSKAKNR